MNPINDTLMDLENDMQSFTQMNLQLYRYWEDNNARYFEEYTSDIEYKWNNYQKEAIRISEELQLLEKKMKDLSEEIDSDFRRYRNTSYI